jgi:hypothetical protein
VGEASEFLPLHVEARREAQAPSAAVVGTITFVRVAKVAAAAVAD